jgi:TrmH family RNA methyltransferase
MKNWKDNVHFILVEPTEPGNIGASARAIKNMGFKNLALVNPQGKITEEADYFAHNAMDVLRSSVKHPTLMDALSDKSLIIGTSRRIGKNRGTVLPIDEAADRIYAESCQKGNVAVLFGREQRGLFNTETDECAFLISIPTDSKQPSLNLAQAVMVVAYELGKYKGDRIAPPLKDWQLPSTHAEQTDLYEITKRILELLGYTKMGDRNIGRKVLITIKHFLGRAGLNKREVTMLYGIFTRLVKRLEKRTGER